MLDTLPTVTYAVMKDRLYVKLIPHALHEGQCTCIYLIYAGALVHCMLGGHPVINTEIYSRMTFISEITTGVVIFHRVSSSYN